jgi:L-seryl-tRNA(Ser) seleniumtransferase
MNQKQLKALPSVSEVLLEVNHLIDLDKRILTLWINEILEKYRFSAKKGKLKQNRKKIIQNIVLTIIEKSQGSLRSVINGTGIVLHTGLGRAPIHHQVIKKASKTMEGYSNLEFHLGPGKRGNRQSHLSCYLRALTGAESAIVVNNNAAAVLLGINTLADKKEVIVSRGQEVEIGGSFRIPDIIEKSGGILKEVGTTNRTHKKDIEKAINTKTGLLLWVHTSNYKIHGYTQDLSLETLVEIGKRKRIPVMADLGSGTLQNISNLGLPSELSVREIMKLNPQLITFSGDKLLGGPQAGIILGSRTHIKKCNQNPLYRTVRCDKLTISLLEETLKLLGSQNQVKYNLALSLLVTSGKQITRRVNRTLALLPQNLVRSFGISAIETKVEAGSGSLPVKALPSAALVFSPKKVKPTVLAEKFRKGNPPLIGYIHRNKFYIDFKSVLSKQDKIIIQLIQENLS